jgi:hypothetical protein
MTGLMMFAGLALAGGITALLTSTLTTVDLQDKAAFQYCPPARCATGDGDAATGRQGRRVGESF